MRQADTIYEAKMLEVKRLDDERARAPIRPPPVGGTVYPTDKLGLYAMVGVPATLALALIALAITKRT